MKKVVLAAAALSLASSAAADQVGFFLVGGQYQQDNGLRYGIGLPIVGLFGGGGIVLLSGDVSYLIPTSVGNSVDAYYGFGLGASVAFAGGGGTGAGALTLTPNVLAGLNFNTGGTFTPFVEASVGPTFAFGASTGGGGAAGVLGVGVGLRVGANFDLN